MKSFKIIYTQIIALMAATIALLMIPLIAMQFTEEVAWKFGDFIIAAILLFGTGLSFLMLSQKSSSFTFKLAVAVALGSTLLLIWSNLAVGLIGSENESINLLYFIIPVVGIVGVFLARFKTIGMSYTLITMAVSMVVIALIAFTTGALNSTGTSTIEVLGINGFFIGLFLLSAFLFKNSEIKQLRTETE